MSLKDKGWTWSAPLEWAKASPWRQAGVDSLEEGKRLRMAAILANGELSFLDRRVAASFRHPKELSEWLLAGSQEWGVDPKFAPMRALARAEQMEALLSRSPNQSGAYWAWREGPEGSRPSGVAGKLAPSNAFTLMFKRRAMPEVALASIAMKGAVSFPAAIGGAMLWPAGGFATFLGSLMMVSGVVAKLVEAGVSDHDKSGSRMRELWALRKAVCSDWRKSRLAAAALDRAKALGYEGAGEGLDDGGVIAKGRPAEELLKEAKELEGRRAKLLKGGLLSALDRGDEAARLGSEAGRLRSAAERMKESQRSQKKPELHEMKWHLNSFATRVASEAQASLEAQRLRARSLSRVEGEELKKATKGSVAGAIVEAAAPAAKRPTRL